MSFQHRLYVCPFCHQATHLLYDDDFSYNLGPAFTDIHPSCIHFFWRRDGIHVIGSRPIQFINAGEILGASEIEVIWDSDWPQRRGRKPKRQQHKIIHPTEPDPILAASERQGLTLEL